MARNVSSIESHPQRQKIIDAIVSRQPYRDIEKWADPPVTRGSLSRFAVSIKASTRDAIESAKQAITNIDNGIGDDVTARVTKAALTAAADPFVQRIMRHQATLDAEIDAARGDARGVAALVSTDLKGLELHARLTGRLETQQQASSTTYVVVPIMQAAAALPAPAVEAEWVEVKADDITQSTDKV